MEENSSGLLKFWSFVADEFPLLRAFSLLPFDGPKKTEKEMTSEEEKEMLKQKGMWESYLGDYLSYHLENTPPQTDWNKKGWNHYALDPKLYTECLNWLEGIAINPIVKETDLGYWYGGNARYLYAPIATVCKPFVREPIANSEGKITRLFMLLLPKKRLEMRSIYPDHKPKFRKN